MQTRKHPRTLNEAFGPYTSNKIEDTDPPMDWQDTVVVWGSAAVVVVFFALILWEMVV